MFEDNIGKSYAVTKYNSMFDNMFIPECSLSTDLRKLDYKKSK